MALCLLDFRVYGLGFRSLGSRVEAATLETCVGAERLTASCVASIRSWFRCRVEV